MNDYTIVDKVVIPEQIHFGRPKKWLPIFNDLPDNKAICFSCQDRASAIRKGTLISSSLSKLRFHKKSRFRTVLDGDKVLLYVWLEGR